jgi:hypothetical protein
LNPFIAKRDGEKVYNDISTSQWWCDIQNKVGFDTVVLCIMLFSDMTLVSGNGRKKAWPLYLSSGNIPKSIRYQESFRACRVLAYLPVISVRKGSQIPPWWSHCKTLIFHHCINIVLQPFKTGPLVRPFFGPNQKIYNCVPALSTYSADYPEQSLLAGTKSRLSGYGCPRCLLEREWFKFGNNHPPCYQRNNKNMSGYSSNGEKGTMKIKNAFLVQNNPYWDIYDALVVDDLHQLGGIYKHLIGLVENMVKKNGKTVIIEKQYQSIPKFRGI